MAKTVKVEVKDNKPIESIQGFFKDLLVKGDIEAILVPQHLPMKNVVMPTLVTDPEKLDGVDPLAPAFPLNAAKVVSKLTSRALGHKLAVTLRSCEIRAFVELVKLKQGRLDDILIIGFDCLGAYSNAAYSRLSQGDPRGMTIKFHENMIAGKGGVINGFEPAAACRACEYPVPENADLQVEFLGMDINQQLLVKANTPAGEAVLARLDLPAASEPPERQKVIEKLVAARTAFRDQMFSDTAQATKDLAGLTGYLANCVNCYNCRVACPVCYCRECVFVTDVFDHDPAQYLQWSKQKGLIKMPTDTVFYHITRLAHMSTACVGCGQCSNACPNDVPVMELFRTIARDTQKVFDYQAGRSVDEAPPLSIFREKEFAELTGGKD
ncbi:MAG: 4Fe-4S dicluster domain-containing protein [Deltaproteobacteria bacterium]|nr:4Fe-4S dicluster domain-containing protein [Deltaproteobacteria bacterium]MBF0525624.1 4Fe-4S dicluster domain-containing protein [Deltaproteobacteria bacterium]